MTVQEERRPASLESDGQRFEQPAESIIRARTDYKLTAWVTGPQGVAMEVSIDHLVLGSDGWKAAAKNAKAFENALIQEGLVPTVTPVFDAASVQKQPPNEPEAVELPGVNGGPPICSLHGAMVQRQGKNGTFYSCPKKVNGEWCRPRKQNAA